MSVDVLQTTDETMAEAVLKPHKINGTYILDNGSDTFESEAKREVLLSVN